MTPRAISYSCNPALKNRRLNVSDLAQVLQEKDGSMTDQYEGHKKSQNCNMKLEQVT